MAAFSLLLLLLLQNPALRLQLSHVHKLEVCDLFNNLAGRGSRECPINMPPGTRAAVLSGIAQLTVADVTGTGGSSTCTEAEVFTAGASIPRVGRLGSIPPC